MGFKKIDLLLVALGCVAISAKGGAIYESEVVEHGYNLAGRIKISEEVIEEPCVLRGLPTDSSPNNLLRLSAISDNADVGDIVWSNPIDGDINYTSVVGTPHYRALTGVVRDIGNEVVYLLQGNTDTKNFTRTFQTREMIRHIALNCNSENEDAIFKRFYYLSIPVLDMTPPTFSQNLYQFFVSSSWNRSDPIGSIFVSDNAYEIEEDDTFLQLSAAPRNVIRVESHRLWTEPYPDIFNHRVDLYLDEAVELNYGQRLQVVLSAMDQYNADSTTIHIFVGV